MPGSPTPAHATDDSRPPTVFIAIDQGMAARFFLRTDVLPTLTAAGARVVALVPNPDEPYLAEELAGQGVRLERLRAAREVVQRSRPWWLVHNLRTFALAHPRRSPAFLDYYRGFRAQIAGQRPLVARLFDAALRPLWRWRLLRRALRALEARLFTPDLHADLFDRFEPDLVVTNSAGWLLPHALILREASRRGVRTAAVVSAWDNPTNKGYRGADPDHIVAWSERMADQLVLHHDLPRGRIVIGGVPHFDHYLREDGLPSREQLFSQLGLDPDRRLVLFATRSPASYLHNPRVAEALAEAVSEDRLGQPAQLVVRLHPVSFRPGYELPLDEYRALADHPHVHLDVPTVLSQRLRTDMPASESIRLGALIKHCDVLVNVFSTTALEALLVDRPVVMVAPDAHREGRGDGAADQPPAGPRAFADYEHTRELVESGAALVARSMPELVELVADYLAHPERDRSQRLEAVARECGPLDGRSGRRVAEQLLAFMGCRAPAVDAAMGPRPSSVPVTGGSR